MLFSRSFSLKTDRLFSGLPENKTAALKFIDPVIGKSISCVCLQFDFAETFQKNVDSGS